jgi:selenocysteine-specific elongation factor
VNLGGVEAASIERGMVLAPAGRLRSTQMIDVQVDVLKSAPRPLRSRARVRVHLGAMEALARVRILEDEGEILPGASGFAQLRLEAAVVALPGERFILRSYSPQQTIAGGRVLDAFAVKHRGREARLAREQLLTLSTAERATQLALFVEMANERGLRRSELAARTGWRDHVLAHSAAQAIAQGTIVDADGIYVGRKSFERLAQAALKDVEAHHKREPLARGMSRETLRERHFTHTAPEVFRAVLAHLEQQGALCSDKEIVRASAHSLSLSPADEVLRNRLEEVYRTAALEAPAFAEALERAGQSNATREHGRKILQLLLDAGVLLRVNNDLLLHREALQHLIEKLREYAAQHEPERLIDVAAFKELAHISRKYAIPLLEYLDRQRITRRAGDRRIIL